MNKLIIVILCLSYFDLSAQKFIGNNGVITFFSEAPMEDISAVNKKVSAVFDLSTGNLVFQLKISDFVFPKSLMQEHFNENYLESDIYPLSFFEGSIIDENINSSGDVRVEGYLTIHGEKNRIIVEGTLLKKKGVFSIKADFPISLIDYNIDIPRIVMYKIAEEVDVSVNIELTEIK